MKKIAEAMAKMERAGFALTRFGLIVVLLWIGGLKVFRYEADGIIPFVANSPFMSFLLHDPVNYKAHMNAEGVLNEENRQWHESNGTYTFALGLGSIICIYGILIGLNPWLPSAGMIGSFLVFVMSFVTLSFLITTPECWVPNLGDSEYGFPYLSGRGRLVVKDLIMMGASLVTMTDSAKSYLRQQGDREASSSLPSL